MEKKGDLLNQIAIISDLLEKINVNTTSTTIVIELSKLEFDRAFDIIQKKYGRRMEIPDGSFTIKMGMVDIIFNTSNV